MRVRLTLAIVLALALAPTAGCKALEKRFTPPPTVVTTEATVAADGADVAGDLGKKVPEGLPVWPGAEVTDQKTTKDAYALQLTTTETYDDVLKGVVVGFERAQWQVAQEESGDAGARIAILTVSNDTYAGYVTLTETEDAAVTIDYLISAAQ